ncbi:hypothetical protein SATMO3_57540 [Sporomusa aerivorans]
MVSSFKYSIYILGKIVLVGPHPGANVLHITNPLLQCRSIEQDHLIQRVALNLTKGVTGFFEF